LYTLISDEANYELRDAVVKSPELIGKTITFDMLADDDTDLFLKGKLGRVSSLSTMGAAGLSGGAEFGNEVTVKVEEGTLSVVLQIVKQYLKKEADIVSRQARYQLNASEAMAARLQVAEDGAEREALGASKQRHDDKYKELTERAADLHRRSALSVNGGIRENLTSVMPSIFVRINSGIVKVLQIAGGELKGISSVVFVISFAAFSQ
jgi:hypothetical protein